jgi:probable rRNA maturation factor
MALLFILVWTRASALVLMVILRKPVPGVTESALGRFVARACDEVSLKGEVNVLLTGNGELRSLNRRFRGKDKATDVLSFPPLAELADGLAGDIAISAEIAVQNAKRLGHSTAEEVRILALHGILHLAGYDHESDSGEMARKEERLRKALGLPMGLIQRDGNDQPGHKRFRHRGPQLQSRVKPRPHSISS